jgi:oxygen-independent coproporphyrinogen-3 oxidase
MKHSGVPGRWSLYVHIPFCTRFCDYCAFYSVPASSDLIERFLNALLLEWEMVAGNLCPQTIYFGGGTPTLLERHQWQRIFAAFQRHGFDQVREWTVEGNPATLDLDQARFLRDHGVNRFSLGIQSLDDALLKRIGRGHNRAQALSSFEILRRAGFDNLNLDLMFAIPTQTMVTWEQTVAEILALGVEHLSCYEVTYEEDTPLYQQLQADRFSLNEDLACDMYEVLVGMAEKAGLFRYEVSNFARHQELIPDECPSRACRHNLNYWRGGPFLGLGPSATSYIEGVRTKNWANVERYCTCLEQGQRPIEETDELSPLARAGETAAFGLRMTAGWPFAMFKELTGFDLRSEWKEEIRLLAEQSMAEVTPERLRLTPKGLRFADWVAEQFLR